MSEPSKKARIMVVDDSASMRAAAKSLLSKDFEVMTCEDGLEAIASLASFLPDLIFVDIVMPKMDGYETVAIIRMNDHFASTPVYMMSSKGGVFDVAKGRLLGFSGEVIKPFKSEALYAIVRKHVKTQAFDGAVSQEAQ